MIAIGDANPPADADLAPCSMTRVTSADVDEHAASLREWSQVYEQLTPGRFVGNLEEIRCGGVQVFRETTSQAVHESGGVWRGARAFGVPVDLSGAARFRGQPVDAETMVTFGGGQEFDFYTPRGFDILGFVVDESALESYAEGVEHRDLGAAIRGRGTLKPAPERLAALRSLLLSVLQSLDENPAALRYRETQRVMTQSLLSAVLGAIPEDEGLLVPPCQSRQYIVDAAKAFMHSHIAESITVAELCIELGVSRRTLQYSFQEVLGINPVRFLRALRLNGVHRDFKRATASPESVQDTAAKWGFWHLSHFVTDYKQMFGELPSDTLRRSRRSSVAPRR